MNNFIEELRRYLEETPQARILEDWAKSAEFDNIGPTVSEFQSCIQGYNIYSSDPFEEPQQKLANEYSPKFSSGFFIIKNSNRYAKSSILIS